MAKTTFPWIKTIARELGELDTIPLFGNSPPWNWSQMSALLSSSLQTQITYSSLNQGWKEPTMKVSVWQKDMKLIHDELAFSKTPAPLFAATQSIYNAAMASGHAEHDTAAVYEVLKRMSSPA